ncbi:hypothetical protein EDC04DRAFT_2610541 [Pisolithus marmoratus]|nr:hypothetical protein EDC04DRAFT_2610541 [Pisolithus marmoratus]
MASGNEQPSGDKQPFGDEWPSAGDKRPSGDKWPSGDKQPSEEDWQQGHHGSKSPRTATKPIALQVVRTSSDAERAAAASQASLLGVLNSVMSGGLQVCTITGGNSGVKPRLDFHILTGTDAIDPKTTTFLW